MRQSGRSVSTPEGPHQQLLGILRRHSLDAAARASVVCMRLQGPGSDPAGADQRCARLGEVDSCRASRPGSADGPGLDLDGIKHSWVAGARISSSRECMPDAFSCDRSGLYGRRDRERPGSMHGGSLALTLDLLRAALTPRGVERTGLGGSVVAAREQDHRRRQREMWVAGRDGRG